MIKADFTTEKTTTTTATTTTTTTTTTTITTTTTTTTTTTITTTTDTTTPTTTFQESTIEITNTTIYFSIELTINRNFTFDLNNVSSILYKNTVKNITSYIRDALESKNLTGFDSLYVAYLKPGSIVATMLLGYVEGSNYPIDDTDIGTAIADGDFNILPIDGDSIIISRVDPGIFSK